MSSKTYRQYYVDGSPEVFRRKKQGRKPSGLGKPKKIRLFLEDEEKLLIMKEKLGIYYNENDIVRNAVHQYLLSNSVPSKLLIP